jgi:hypothetical protein
MSEVKTHPVQLTPPKTAPRVPVAISLRAYEVYKELHGEQEAIITGNCRGGFGVGELLVFLYVRSFPKEEWRQREQEAIQGLNVGS